MTAARVVAIALLAGLYAAAEQAPSAGATLAAEAKGKHGKEAIELYTQAIAKDPGLIEAWVGRAVERRWEEPLPALADLAHAEAASSRDFPSAAVYWRGMILFDQLLDRGAAFDEMQKLSRRGQGGWAWLGSAVSKFLIGKADNAQEDLDKILKSDPSIPQVHRWKAMCSFDAGDVLGMAEAEKGVRESPEDPSAQATRALCMGLDNAEAAVKDLESIIREHPTYAWAHIARAKVLEKAKKWDDAIAACEAAEKAAAASPETAYFRALALTELGKLDEALAALTNAVSWDPQFGDAVKARAALRMKMRDWAGAARDYEAAIRFAADDKEVGAFKAKMEEAQKNERRDSTVLTSVEALCQRADKYLQEKEPDFDRARADLEKARTLDDKNAVPALVWMKYWGLKKDIVKFFESTQQAVDLGANAWYELARGETFAWLKRAPAFDEMRKDPQFKTHRDVLTLKSAWDLYFRADERYNDAQEKKGDAEAQKACWRGANEDFDKLVQAFPDHQLVSGSLYNMACCYSLMGDVEKAFEYLDKSIEKGFNDAKHMDEDTDLDNIRKDPRYAEAKKKAAAKK